MGAVITISSILSASDAFTVGYLTRVYPALANMVSWPVYYAAVIYWGVYGYKVFEGHTPFLWKEFLNKVVMLTCVFAALNWGSTGLAIYHMFTGFMDSTATTILGGDSASTLMDTLHANVQTVSDNLLRADSYMFGTIIQGFGLFVINCLLFIIAVAYMLIAKFALAITMSLLPIFVAFFFFEATRHWATNWLNKMMNYCFLYIIVVAIVKLGFSAFGVLVAQAASAAKIADVSKINSLTIGYLTILEGILIIFMLLARGWAASLSNGCAAGSGALMMMIRAVTKGVVK